MIDEVSIVPAPLADGNARSVTAFENHGFLTMQAAAGLTLLEVQRLGILTVLKQTLDADAPQLRYVPKKIGIIFLKALDMK